MSRIHCVASAATASPFSHGHLVHCEEAHRDHAAAGHGFRGVFAVESGIYAGAAYADTRMLEQIIDVFSRFWSA
jgi:hypothetical protein